MNMYRKEVVYTYAQKKMVKKRWKRADGWSCAHDDDYVCAQYEHTHTHTYIHTYIQRDARRCSSNLLPMSMNQWTD